MNLGGLISESNICISAWENVSSLHADNFLMDFLQRKYNMPFSYLILSWFTFLEFVIQKNQIRLRVLVALRA